MEKDKIKKRLKKNREKQIKIESEITNHELMLSKLIYELGELRYKEKLLYEKLNSD